MELTLSSETSAFILRTPGKFPKEHRLHSEHGESLKTTTTGKIHIRKVNISWVYRHSYQVALIVTAYKNMVQKRFNMTWLKTSKSERKTRPLLCLITVMPCSGQLNLNGKNHWTGGVRKPTPGLYDADKIKILPHSRNIGNLCTDCRQT